MVVEGTLIKIYGSFFEHLPLVSFDNIPKILHEGDDQPNDSDNDHDQRDIDSNESDNNHDQRERDYNVISKDAETTNTVLLSTQFTLEMDRVFHYWTDATRSFVRHRTGKDWPSNYGSPCAVVVRYDHVKAADSRKRNVSFARIRGVCTICQAKHIYDIKDSPFEESKDADGKILYSVVNDLCVDVTVEGIFHLKDGQPDIKQPIHSISKAKGLDLRGEERRLIGMKASMEGPMSVYREGMAFAQKEQIESANRTSVRSLPVIR